MTALLGTFVKVSTMADGTPRIVLDMQCSLSDIAAMGLVPGVPFGLARITNESAQTPPPEEKPKGGELAKLAGMWCNDPKFCDWLRVTFPDQWDANASPTNTPFAATASVLRAVCLIESRAELDSDRYANTRFQTLIREPYMAYMSGRTE